MNLRNAFCSTLLAAAALTLTPQTLLAEFLFTQVVDTNTLAPGGVGGGGTFRSVFDAKISGNNVAFFGQDQNSTGFYLSKNGVLSRVVDSNTPQPGSANTFGSFLGRQDISISGDRVAFSPRSAFVAINGQISAVAEQGDLVPGREPAIFAAFRNQEIEGSTIALSGGFGPFTNGLYVSRDGLPITKVIDSLDQRPIPGFVNRDFFTFTANDLDNESILFTGGAFNSTDGIFTTSFSGQINTVVDTNTPIPDGVGTFTNFDARFPQRTGGKIVFFGTGANDGPNRQGGIYLRENGQITKIADFSTIDPTGTGAFSDLREPAILGDSVLFYGSSAAGTAIYESRDGVLTEIVKEGDSINGQRVTRLFSSFLDADGQTLVFGGGLIDGTNVIFTATRAVQIPEPGSLLLLLMGISVTVGHVSRTRR